MADYTYKTLISQVISDFDSIYTALRNKKVLSGNLELPEKGDTGIATSQYATLIAGQLYRVDGNPTVVLSNGVIANKTGVQATAGTLSIEGDVLTITSGLTPGYYDGTSTLTASLTNLREDPVIFSPTDTTHVKLEGNTYTVTAGEGKILDEIKIAKGTINFVDHLGQSAEAPATVTPVASLTSNDVTLSTTETDGWLVKLSKKASLTGKIVADEDSSSTITSGYVLSSEVTHQTGEFDLSSLSIENAIEDSYYIPKGGISVTAVDAPTTINASNVATSDTETSFAIEVTVASPTVTVDTTEGYSKKETGKSITTTGQGSTETIYIQAATLTAKSTNAAKPTISADGTLSKISLSAAEPTDKVNNYVSTIKTNELNVGYDLTTEGYIEEAPAALTVGADTAYISVAKGSGTVTMATPSDGDWSVTAGEDYLHSSGKAVTVSLAPTVTKSINEGYITASEITLNAPDTVTKTVYIKEATPDLTSNISVVHTNLDNIANPSLAEIFTTDVSTIQGRDYWTIDSTASLAALDGYVSTQDATVVSSGTKYYLPRATLKYVEDVDGTDSGKNILMVEKSGYLPSGSLLDISDITGTIEYASVAVVVDQNVGALTLNSNAADAYVVTLTKGNVDAGYISQTDGEGNVSGTLKIAHAKASATAAISSVAANIETPLTANAGVYTIPVSITGKVSATVTEGYIKTSDLTVNGTTATSGTNYDIQNLSQTLTMTQGVVEVSTDSSEISASVSSDHVDLTATEDTGYAISAVLGSETGAGAITIETKTAGYIGTDYSTTANIAIASGNATKYVKKGTAPTVSGSKTGATLTDNFSSGITGAYTITLDETIPVTGTVADGYYKANAAETAITGNATISGSLSVAHGSVSVGNVTATPNVTFGEGLTYYSTVAEGDKGKYYAITPTIGNVNVNVTTVQGYVKEADVDTTKATISSSGATTYYIEKFNSTIDANYTGDTAAGYSEKAYNPFGENGAFGGTYNGEVQDEYVVQTAEKYNDKDIIVRLHADACGSAVRTELSALEARLAGYIA